jgi:hypothetical protein
MAHNSLRILFTATAFMITAHANVHAAAIGSADIVVDWNTLLLEDNVTGTPLVPTSIVLPPELGGGSTTSDADTYIWYGDEYFYGEDGDFGDNGASSSVSYDSGSISTSASYTSLPTNESAVSVSINNAGIGSKYAGGGVYRNALFEATDTGRIKFSVDYTANGSASGADGNYQVNGGFNVNFFAVFDAEIFIDEYLIELENNGGDSDAAEDAAFQAALVKNIDDVFLGGFNVFLGCTVGNDCQPTLDLADTLETGFDVEAGRKYVVELEVEANIDTYFSPSPVPVPAAVWLFGSGLIGLVGIARRKKESIMIKS